MQFWNRKALVLGSLFSPQSCTEIKNRMTWLLHTQKKAPLIPRVQQELALTFSVPMKISKTTPKVQRCIRKLPKVLSTQDRQVISIIRFITARSLN
jgi:hypothetical protein